MSVSNIEEEMLEIYEIELSTSTISIINVILSVLSIPQDTINTEYRQECITHKQVFQFHKVQLTLGDGFSFAVGTGFQFHKVQLTPTTPVRIHRYSFFQFHKVQLTLKIIHRFARCNFFQFHKVRLTLFIV